VSRLTDLIAQAKAKDAQMGADLEREYKVLSSRLAFGLNFERHRPESVQLPQRPVRRGDKVAILPKRGSTSIGDSNRWIVKSIATVKGSRVASVEPVGADEPKAKQIPVDDLVVVAEFRDLIFPGLNSTGRVERGGAKPFHTVINGENYHALKSLAYTHRGKVDAIYIDPPYNGGARDWKYNNAYVEEDDLYRHSKWLAFMDRRLRLARDLLNPAKSVLIVTIDDKEGSRLGLLLEQVFQEARIEMITSVINPRGKYRKGEFARCEEYIYFVAIGNASVLGEPDEAFSEGALVSWRTLRRSDIDSRRGAKKGGTAQFYPIFVDQKGRIKEIGGALPHGTDRDKVPVPHGCSAVFPIREDGTEMNWGVTGATLSDLLQHGYVRVGRHTPAMPQTYEILYLTSGRVEDIRTGRAEVVGKNADGSVVARYVTHKVKFPLSTWNRPSHNAEIYGTDLLKSILGEKLFPFPKSLYAVEDCLRFFIADNPNATVLDFFAGSGTTAHAVMRLNRQDGGQRQCISVTNNEVGAEEEITLRKNGLRPGDPEWERWGICDYVTKPRIKAAITGKTPDGKPIEGDYKFADEFPITEGFEENAEFFNLTYETPVAVGHNLAFNRIAPLLWMRAGSRGTRIDTLPSAGWEVAGTYGLLVDLDKAAAFCGAVDKAYGLRIAYVVTDDDRRFQAVVRRLPESVEPIRLFESYLLNFQFSNGE